MSFRWRSTAPVLALLALPVSGCARPPDLIGVDNPAVPAASVPAVSRHRIFLTSTRAASEIVGAFYSGVRAPALSLASVDVTVPPTHIVGELERPNSLPPDPRTEFAVVNPVIYRDDGTFISEVNRELAARQAEAQELLLFIHGYNNTTSDAILRLTQFVEDTQFPGVPVLSLGLPPPAHPVTSTT